MKDAPFEEINRLRAKTEERQIGVLVQKLAHFAKEAAEWQNAARRCGLYRDDAPVNSPEDWQREQLHAASKLLSDLENAQRERDEARELLAQSAKDLLRLKTEQLATPGNRSQHVSPGDPSLSK